MARPLKDGLPYFPHDSDSASDPKIEALLLLYGGNGYSFYYLHLEYIYRSKDAEFNISAAETKQIICRKLKITQQKYEQILLTCLNVGLFDNEYYQQSCNLTSNGVKKRVSTITAKRVKMRTSYKERVSSPISAAETEQKVHKGKVKGKVNIKGNKEIKTALEIAIDNFKMSRVKNKKPMTDRAVELLIDELNKLASDDDTKIAILNQSILHGWQGVFPLKDDKKKASMEGWK